MPRISTIEKFEAQLFDDLTKINATDLEKAQIKRYRHLIDQRLAFPSRSNTELVGELTAMFNISPSQAYRDLGEIEKVLGRISNTSKSFIRYTVVETLREAISMAKEKGDYAEMTKGSAVLGKYSRLDKEDPQYIPYEEIVPPSVEFVNNPTLVGVDVGDPIEFVKKIKKKFDVEDVEYTEVNG